MRHKSWKSRLDPKLVKQRREQVDSLLALANGHLTTGTDFDSGIAAYYRATGVSALKTLDYHQLVAEVGKHIASLIEAIIDPSHGVSHRKSKGLSHSG
jgi:hypothetical protein